MKPHPDDGLVDVAAVALALHVSRVTVRRWVRLGTIPFVRTGSQPPRFDLDAVTETVQAHRRNRLTVHKYWPEKQELAVWAENILGAAADTVLSWMDPYYSRDPDYVGFVSREELMVEGWFLSFRYCKGDHQLRYQFLHSITHMKTAYVNLRYEKSGGRHRPNRVELGDDPEFVCPYSKVGFEAVDLIDEIARGAR